MAEYTVKQRTYGQRIFVSIGKKILRWSGEFEARHSLIPSTPKIDNQYFPWVTELENTFPQIREELLELLKYPEKIPAFHQISPDQQRISKGSSWKTFGMYVFGERIDENCRLCPHTDAALAAIPNMRTAMFSILQPHYHIVPHRGPSRAVVRVHLGLIVPKDQPEKLWIRVDNQRLHWEEGKVIIFDDFYEHEVRNDTDELRAVLFIDVDRPMDKLGTWVNKLLFALIKASPYVKQPLKNLAKWNR
ncbi:aspartyl/asparaginyl beta-hydroxylase domain-containing protein [Rosenbergiella australiborealis]|uniref:Aspartyl/asparaginyl beta-hydroxylase domain-containing protein n=1 Tax=Rosenbergiella australiborealis TaxID=1544696 RepID=A0ABS5T750_9GAMM|nr:aspartyl/asparaginyl beta-hydroxylase domain-containing protein [Rosenbergiella australiborealis]MBT0728199.1 aspartyl/asparaginyl beta-hydroxylase domain-containing protein [Rosenbergiella australiborealis]